MNNQLRILAALTLLIITGAIGLLIYFYLKSPNVITDSWGGPSEFGQFGDMIGGILNPIFGFFTILLLLHTANLQHKNMQREKNIRNFESTIKLLAVSKKKFEDMLDKNELHDSFSNDYFSLKNAKVFYGDNEKRRERIQQLSSDTKNMLNKRHPKDIDNDNEMFLHTVRISQRMVIKHYYKLLELEDFEYAKSDIAIELYEFIWQNSRYNLLTDNERSTSFRISGLYTEIHNDLFEKV